jgi:hypothetical protein
MSARTVAIAGGHGKIALLLGALLSGAATPSAA